MVSQNIKFARTGSLEGEMMNATSLLTAKMKVKQFFILFIFGQFYLLYLFLAFKCCILFLSERNV